MSPKQTNCEPTFIFYSKTDFQTIEQSGQDEETKQQKKKPITQENNMPKIKNNAWKVQILPEAINHIRNHLQTTSFPMTTHWVPFFQLSIRFWCIFPLQPGKFVPATGFNREKTCNFPVIQPEPFSAFKNVNKKVISKLKEIEGI